MQPNIVYNLIPPTVKDWTPTRGGNRPEYIVLHTTDCSLRQAENLFHTGARKASANRIIGLNGDVVIEVSDGDTAWGAANWYVNQRGLNLEHEDNGNFNDAARTPNLYAAAAWQVADWCRRYGIPCQKVNVDGNHRPTGPGIVLHREVSQLGTACPDGLDWQRIIREAQALLAPPPAPAHPGMVPWGPDKVRVTVQTLRVHTQPTLSSPGNAADTPDGMLHDGNLAGCDGFLRGDLYMIDGQTSNLWCHSPQGHFYAALGTDAPFNHTQQPLAETAPLASPGGEPKPIQTAAPEWVRTYTPGPGYVILAETTAHDFEGKSEDRILPADTGLDVAGTFTVNAVLYLRSKWSAANNRWVGIPKSAGGPYVSAHKSALTPPQKAAGVLASGYGKWTLLLDKILRRNK